MSVDKFGHYLHDKSDLVSIKNAPKLLGFFVDTNNNIDIQNKRIKNVAKALEENDVVSKVFMQTQIEKIEDKLNQYFKADNDKIQENILKNKLFFEEQIKKIDEKINGLESYIFSSVAITASTNTSHTKTGLIKNNNDFKKKFSK